jgi:hypothetical protein
MLLEDAAIAVTPVGTDGSVVAELYSDWPLSTPAFIADTL